MMSSEESDSAVPSCHSDSEDSLNLIELHDLVENCKKSGLLFRNPIPARKEVHPEPDEEPQPSTSCFAAPLTAQDFEFVEDQANAIDNTCALNDPMIFPSNQSCLSPEDVLTSTILEPERLPIETNYSNLRAAKVHQKDDPENKKADATRLKKTAQEERMKGEKYLGCRRKVKGKTNLIIRDAWKEERKMKDRGCSKLCERSTKTNCGRIPENERKELFGTFWKKMSWDSKKTYVVSTIRAEHVKERTNGAEASRRSYTYRYHLKVNDEHIPVCKNMYLNTLGLKESETRHWLSTFLEHSQPTAPRKNELVEDLDTGDTNEPNRRISEGQTRRARVNRVKILEDFLNSLPKLPSHYCRKSSSKQYLQLDIRSKAQLYSLYVEHCKEINTKPASLHLLRKKCKKMKIGVFKPRKDRCDLCYQFESGNLDEACYNQHIEKKNESSAEKQKDKEDAANPEKPDVHLICIDLMAVQNVPLIRASASYYKLKLCIHNFTVYNLSTNDALCYWFDETATSLNASAFASMIVDYLQELLASSLRPIIIYSDGCTAQNRNSVLSNALLHLAVSSGIQITQKYLEKGHTYMECDSVHSTVEQKFKYLDVFLPSNFVQITTSARRFPFPYRAKLVDYTFFKDFTCYMKYPSIRPGRSTGDPVVVDVREFLYCPSGIIKYKLRFSESLKELPQRPRSASFTRIDDFPPMHGAPQNIQKDKWSDLQDLKKLIPQDCHHFYDNLPHHEESIREKKRKEEKKKR